MSTNPVERAAQTAVFLALPILLLLFWLPILPDRAHLSLTAARDLLVGELSFPIANSPLWLLLLSLLPLEAAATLSALGWGTTAVLLAATIRQTAAPQRADWLPLLLLLSPLLPATLGTAVSWQMALLLLLIRSATAKNQAVPWLLLLLLSFFVLDWVSLLFLLGWLGWQWQKSGRFPWQLSLLLLVSLAAALLSLWLLWGRLPTGWPPDWLLSRALLHVFGVMALAWLSGWLVRWLAPQVRADAPVRAVQIVPLLLLPLLLVQVGGLWQQYQARPVTHHALLAQAGAWMMTPGVGQTAVLADPAAAPQLSTPLRPFLPPDEPTAWRDWLAELLDQPPPDAVLSSSSPDWDRLRFTGWFQERYSPVQQLDNQESALSPVTVWAYQPSPFDEGEVEPLTVSADNGLQLISHQTWPRRIQPGDAIYVTLNWQTAVPLTDNVNTIVRVVSPIDQVGWAQQSLRTPRSLPPEWIVPNVTTFPERFVLTTTAEIPIGAYQINMSLTTGRDEVTFTPLFQNNDVNALDRILLGYLSVPWPGEIPADAVSLNGRYGEQMLLDSYTLSGELRPGEPLLVTLYWRSLRPPDADYTIFVHLLDEAGNFILGDDRIPLNGRFPTRGLLPDRPTPDEHPLLIPPDLPAGTYQLQVGVYLPETGVRLEAVNAAGETAPNQSLFLQTIEISP